jgi:4-amino-4-deoxy-L-arabinose transferase-like glycosyltransferase
MQSKPFSISTHLPILFLLIFLSFFAHLGSIPLFDADEGTYSEVTREMLTNKNFTSVLLNGVSFPHKPPLFYWAQATSIKILGLKEFSLRLPSAIAALLWVASIFLFTRRCYGTRSAWHASLFMCSSLLVTLVGRSATPEALLNLFLSLTMLNIYRFYQTGHKRHIYWSFMFAALGVLTKGGIALLLPVTVSLIFFGMKKKWQELLLLFFNPVGLLVLGLILIPWYLGEFMLHGETFPSDLLMLQGMTSYAYNFIGSSLPYYSYPVLIFIGLLPFSAIFVKAFLSVGKLMSDDLLQFLIIWFFLAFLFLPLVQPKSIFSIAYCLPPLFIIMARVTEFMRHSINIFIWPLLIIILLMLMPYLASYITGFIQNEFIRNTVMDGIAYLNSFYKVPLGSVILLLAGLPFIKPVPQPVKYGILGLLFVSLLNFFIMPFMADILQQPIKSAGLLAKHEKLSVIKWKINSPSFNVYAETLSEVRHPQPGDTVLTKSAYLVDGMEYEILFEKQGIILAKILKIPENRSD